MYIQQINELPTQNIGKIKTREKMVLRMSQKEKQRAVSKKCGLSSKKIFAVETW